MLGVPKSTVHDAWSRVQRSIRLSVDRYLEGGYCKESAPYLALLDAQRRAERDGSEDRPFCSQLQYMAACRHEIPATGRSDALTDPISAYRSPGPL